MRYAVIFIAFLVGCNGCNGSMTDACIPGLQQACACVGGGQGIQRCASDGSGFEACIGCQATDDMAKSPDIASLDMGTEDIAVVDMSSCDLAVDMTTTVIDLSDPGDAVIITPADLTTKQDIAVSTDMATCGGNICGVGITCCNAVCVNLQKDSANCGICGNACPVGTVCNLGQCLYQHVDPFCFFFAGANNYWYDNMANPSPLSSAESELACNSCCSATLGAGCPCLQDFTFVGNEKWEYWTFFANPKGSAFFYYSGMLAGEGTGTDPAVKTPQPWFK